MPPQPFRWSRIRSPRVLTGRSSPRDSRPSTSTTIQGRKLRDEQELTNFAVADGTTGRVRRPGRSIRTATLSWSTAGRWSSQELQFAGLSVRARSPTWHLRFRTGGPLRR